jgi:hypothetical protein
MEGNLGVFPEDGLMGRKHAKRTLKDNKLKV